MTGKFIAYYRVSTKKQGQSGLGLDAQRESVMNFLNGGHWELIEEYTEIESGKKEDRPQLIKALEHCKMTGAKLIIAKLDRLARNVHFISGLMESGVEFQAVDLPEANKLTVHIMASMAEHEREMISKRTKEGLAQAKKRGIKLGKPENLKREHAERGRTEGNKAWKSKADKFAIQMFPVIENMLNEGISLRAVARELNEGGYLTSTGKHNAWTPTAVKNVIKRHDQLKEKG